MYLSLIVIILKIIMITFKYLGHLDREIITMKVIITNKRITIYKIMIINNSNNNNDDRNHKDHFSRSRAPGQRNNVRDGAYQIIVADAADAVSVNFSGRCKFLQI